ncbi:hypothetical protein BC830DRAFT_1155022, partial [Chytriomyces sp. MP71]
MHLLGCKSRRRRAVKALLLVLLLEGKVGSEDGSWDSATLLRLQGEKQFLPLLWRRTLLLLVRIHGELWLLLHLTLLLAIHSELWVTPLLLRLVSIHAILLLLALLRWLLSWSLLRICMHWKLMLLLLPLLPARVTLNTNIDATPRQHFHHTVHSAHILATRLLQLLHRVSIR